VQLTVNESSMKATHGTIRKAKKAMLKDLEIRSLNRSITVLGYILGLIEVK
jgi:hypothetical protein